MKKVPNPNKDPNELLMNVTYAVIFSPFMLAIVYIVIEVLEFIF